MSPIQYPALLIRAQSHYVSLVRDNFFPSFFVNKPNGDERFILNLRKLNSSITSQHFKMKDIRLALKLLKPGWLNVHNSSNG